MSQAEPSELFRRQRDHLFFTWSVQSQVGPLEIVDAAGPRFATRDHGWLWDLESQVYNVSAGHRHPHIQRRMIAQIEASLKEYSKEFRSFERVSKFALIEEDFTTENDMLTPSLKLKRRVVMDRYGALIQGLYGAPKAAS